MIALLADLNKFEPHFGLISNLGKNFLAIDLCVLIYLDATHIFVG